MLGKGLGEIVIVVLSAILTGGGSIAAKAGAQVGSIIKKTTAVRKLFKILLESKLVQRNCPSLTRIAQIMKFDPKGIFCFTAATLVSVFAWNAEAATYELVRQPIESIEVGDRVVTHDGDINGRNEGLNPQDYRKLTVRTVCVCPDGSVDEIRVTSLVERTWLDRHLQHREGRLTAPLDLTAMGLDEVVSADVVSVEPCPEISDGPGQIVMTTVAHLNRQLIHLTIENELGQRETIESTAYHKFFSKSRGDWVSAIELEPNEVLDGLGGSLVVVQVLPVEGEETVFNLSVRGDHVYRVGGLGVLVHNDDCKSGPKDDSANPGITRSDHAKLRSAQGRPIGQVVNDAQRAGKRDVFVQPDDGRIVVRGPNGREHIIEPNGEHVTRHYSSARF